MTEERGLVPFSLDDIKGLGEVFHQSGMFPDIKTAAQAVVKIAAGRELGLPPVYSMTHIFMLQGRVTVGATIIATLIKRSGRYDYLVEDLTDDHCVLTFLHNGQAVYHSTFTLEDAKRADLVKPGSAWIKTPRAMLFARAVSQGARVVCPEVLAGVYVTEEFIEGEITVLPEMPTPDEEASEQPPQQVEDQPQAPPEPKLATTNKASDMSWEWFWDQADKISGTHRADTAQKMRELCHVESMVDWKAKGHTLKAALDILRKHILDQKAKEQKETTLLG